MVTLEGEKLVKSVVSKLETNLGEVVQSFNDDSILVKKESIFQICKFLKEDSDLCFDYLVNLCSVDYIDHFEVVYRLRSFKFNSTVVIKAKVGFNRESPKIDSVYSLWRGSDLMEREVWDLMGIEFNGHPNLKRIMLWEGFDGHPLRKDYLFYQPHPKS